jgi:anti-sigma factor RsiW
MIPDIDHAEMHNLFNAALDGEMDALTALRFETHMAVCPACAADYARLKTMSTAIRDGATRHAAPDALRDALLQSLALPAETATPARASNVIPFRRWLRPATGGFALGAALAASIAVLVDNRTADNAIADSIVIAHIRALQPGHLTDVQISDQHQVKPWFDGKIDFAPPVKELGEQGFDLVGGRLDYINRHEAAVVVYRRKLHMIDLFVTRAAHDRPGQETAPAPAATPSGYNVERWSAGGQDYWAVSDLNRAELADFAKAWHGRQ